MHGPHAQATHTNPILALQVFSPVCYLSWVVHLIPLVAGCAMGSQRYAANRYLPILATRILTMHYSTALGLVQGLFLSLSWPAFAYWLAMGTQGVSQLWLVFAYRLPLGLHATAVLVTATEYLLRVPSLCSSPPVGHPCVIAASAKPASAAACAAAGGKFEVLADLMDWPLAYFVPVPLANHYPVSDIALCSVVLAWSHVAFAVVGSTALAAILQSWQGRALGEEQLGAGDFVSRRTVSGVRQAWQPSSMKDAVLYTSCGLQCLWCVLRVVYIKMY